MEMAHNVSIPELTEAISARLVAQWEARLLGHINKVDRQDFSHIPAGLSSQ